ncbi:unnamed protein product [Urochloa humidicola]
MGGGEEVALGLCIYGRCGRSSRRLCIYGRWGSKLEAAARSATRGRREGKGDSPAPRPRAPRGRPWLRRRRTLGPSRSPAPPRQLWFWSVTVEERRREVEDDLTGGSHTSVEGEREEIDKLGA